VDKFERGWGGVRSAKWESRRGWWRRGSDIGEISCDQEWQVRKCVSRVEGGRNIDAEREDAMVYV